MARKIFQKFYRLLTQQKDKQKRNHDSQTRKGLAEKGFLVP